MRFNDFITTKVEVDRKCFIYDDLNSISFSEIEEERRKEQPNLLYPDSDEIYKRYYELKKENERLAKEIDMWNGLYNIEFDKARKYKSRNEKAIEYIKENGIIDLNGYDLLNILENKND